MKKTLLTTTLLILPALVAPAQVRLVTVKVDGLACAFCAYGLQKGLKRVEGVKDVKVYVDAGKAELRFKEGAPAGLAEIGPAVKKAGYTPAEITVEVTGRLIDWNGKPALAIDGAAEKLLLDGGDALRRMSAGRNPPSAASLVTVVGTLEQINPPQHHGHPLTLHIKEIRVAEG